MSKSWPTLLLSLLLLVQTLSVAADVSPVHLGEAQSGQAGSHHSLGEQRLGGGGNEGGNEGGNIANQAETEGPALSSSHCHACHCLGSHLLLTMQPVDLPLLQRESHTPTFDAHLSAGHIAAILRPPIV